MYMYVCIYIEGRLPETRVFWSRRTSTNCYLKQDTPDQIRVFPNTVDGNFKLLVFVNCSTNPAPSAFS